MATIDDVAKRVGLSKMTVSRVINNSGYVKEATRLKVQKAIEELQYSPNMIAKTLATKRSNTLAYVMVNISDPFHNLVSKGIETVSFHNQYTVMMCDAHYTSREQDYISMFSSILLGGAIFHHLAITKEQIEGMQAAGMKCVLIDNEVVIHGVNTICTDNHYGAKLAVDHLFYKGHRRIGCVYGYLKRHREQDPLYEDTFQFNIWRNRTKGFQDAIRRHGLATDLMFQSNGRIELAVPYSKKILDRILAMDDRPTALYCENDIMAIAIINEMMERGMKVPDDMAIVGHDGLDICTMIHPHITTIAQPRYEMGMRAATILLDSISNNVPAKTEILKPSLLIGETT